MKNSFLIITIFCFTIVAKSQCDSFNIAISTYNPTCPGFNDGSITATVTGATGDVTGQITDSSGAIMIGPGMGTTPNILAAGWYYIYVYDEAGCEISDSVYLVDPDEMEIILNITLPSSLSACDGIAEVDTVLFHNGNYLNLGFFWAPGGPGGIGQTIKTGLCYGDYMITVNNEVGCGLTKDFSVGNLSVGEDQSTPNYQLFPNPVQNQINLSNTGIKVNQLTIYSIDGKEVFNQKIENQNSVDVSDLPAGVYVVAVSSEEGIFTVKILKE